VQNKFPLRKAAILGRAFRGELTAQWREENKDNSLTRCGQPSSSLNEIAGQARNDEALLARKDEHSLEDTIPKEEQPYDIPESWVWVKTGSLIDLYRGVSFGKDDVKKSKKKNSCLIMRGGNIEEGSINFDDNVYVDKSIVKPNQFIKKHDVIIVSSTGSTKVIGRAGISDDDYSDVAFGAFLTLVRSSKQFNKKFIALFFQTEMYRNTIRGLAKGTNINNLRNDYILNMPFPLPPLAEQEEIVRRLESIFEKEEKAKEICNMVEKIELMKKAILARAFRGELTSQ